MKIRKLPAQSDRVDTGPVQFGHDWPGVFIRGDDAGSFAASIRRAMNQHRGDGDLLDLLDLLASCIVKPTASRIRRKDLESTWLAKI